MKLSDWLERGDKHRRKHKLKIARETWGIVDNDGQTKAVCAIAAGVLADWDSIELPTAWGAVSYDRHIADTIFGGDYFFEPVVLPHKDMLGREGKRLYDSVGNLTGWILNRFDDEGWSVKHIVEELRKVGL